MINRRTRVAVVATTLLLTGSLVACGGDSTVDSDDGGSGVPSVSSTPTTSASESAASSPSSPAPSGSDGDSPRDGEVNEVEEPAGEAAARTEVDDAFLAQLKDNDIDLEDTDVQDQVIAAAREQCLANEEGRDGFAVPMIAGQLEVQELTDVSAEDAQRIITEAAEQHYCG